MSISGPNFVSSDVISAFLFVCLAQFEEAMGVVLQKPSFDFVVLRAPNEDQVNAVLRL